MGKIRIFTITVLSLLLSAPAMQGKLSPGAETALGRPRSMHPIAFALGGKSMVVAQNEQTAAEGGGQKKSESQDQSPDSGAAAGDNSSNSSNDAASKPLKPFKPSEEIAAEQAVDFPVDI